MARPIIAFITEDDPRDKRSWSGTNHFMWKALEEHVGSVEILGPYTPQPLRFFCSIFNFVTLRLLGKRFDYRHSNLMRKAYGKHFSALLSKKKYDSAIISASVSTAAGIKTSVPVIYINDRVIAGAMNYHKVLTQLFEFSKHQSLANDKSAIENSTVSVFCSHWSADAAKKYYGFDAGKVQMIPFGANLEQMPDAPATIDFPPDKVKLLFVGVNWNDKGGQVAFEALKHLVNSGIKAELAIVGCHPPEGMTHPSMKVYGFLNKNNPDDFSTLMNLFSQTHFFILPTKYEAYGLVFCEAAAYGVPALAPATGGVPTIIEDNVTGFLFEENTPGEEYAEKIKRLLADPARWKSMREAAYKKYREQLNWHAWGVKMAELIRAKGITRD